MGTIPARELASLWRTKFGVEVGQFFLSDDLRLEEVSPYGYFRFSSAIPGDPEFYARLMARMGYERSEKAEFREAASHIGPQETVLDVGCGTGNFSIACKGIYRGIDTNPRAIEDGRSQNRNVHIGLLEDEQPGRYDVVTIFQVLEHVDHPKPFIDAAVRCLRPGGKIFVSTPDMAGFIGYAANEVLNYPPHHMSWWADDSLSALLDDCGCQTDRVWHESLRRDHLSGALTAILCPRGEKHLDRSFRFKGVNFVSRVLAHFAYPRWEEIPFIKGHTVMVQGTKE